MGRPISNIDPSIEILWLKFKESDLCPNCSKWDVTIRRQHTRDRPPRFFYRYDCQLCKTSWAPPWSQVNLPANSRVRVK